MLRNGSAEVHSVEQHVNQNLKHYVDGQQAASQAELDRKEHLKQLAQKKRQQLEQSSTCVRIANIHPEKDASTVYQYFQSTVGGVECAHINTKYDEETKRKIPCGSARVVFKDATYVQKLVTFSQMQQSRAIEEEASQDGTRSYRLMNARAISKDNDGFIRFWLADLKDRKAGGSRPEAGPMFKAESLQLGNQISEDKFSIWWEAVAETRLELSELERSLHVKCQHNGTRYCLTFKLKSMRGTCRLFLDNGAKPEITLMFSVNMPPFVYKGVPAGKRLKANPLMSTTYPPQFEEEEWTRTVDFTSGNAIGTCRMYRLNLGSMAKADMKKLVTALNGMRLLNKDISPAKQRLEATKVSTNEVQASMLDSVRSHQVHWRVRCLMSKDLLHIENISQEFIELLNTNAEHRVLEALDEMMMLGKPIYHPVESLQRSRILQQNKAVETIPPVYCVRVPRVLITPTRVVCHPPEQEMSNRVLRQFQDMSHQFLRVACSDEDGKRLYLKEDVGEELKARIRQFLVEGIRMGGVYYRFLAFSSSQIRDHSCWMFSPAINFGPEHIRKFMGDFSHIRIPGKYAARMGQCFSSTIQTIQTLDDNYEEIDDVTFRDADGKEHVFSDGVGRISYTFALEIAESIRSMGLSREWEVPSAFQIRYRGCKGMLAWWPFLGKSRKVQVRPSMKKFESGHPYIEVLAWARFMPGHLNRQIVVLLSTLKIPDSVFLELQRDMVKRLNSMLESASEARVLLPQLGGVDEPVTACLKGMLDAGLPPTDPFLHTCLLALRAWNLKEIRQRARIFVKDSCYLYGIMDEVGVLEYGQVYVCIQPSPTAQPTAVKGCVIVTKNPCLHPGDIRILEAVVPQELAHLKNVVVFPRKGPRPHPAECSGSDLDGDQYYVCWDQRLVPQSMRTPYHYPSHKQRPLDRDVTITDIIDFFIRHMENDNLGRIANAHVCWADSSPKQADDPRCLQLAELHHFAVDFNKTGVPAQMDEHLRPRTVPHFLEKKDRRTYHSNSIIGQLYDEIVDVPDKLPAKPAGAAAAVEARPDPGLLLDNFPEWEQYVRDALPVRFAYENELIKIMDRYEVFSEGELITGCILHCNKYQKRQREYNVKIQVLGDVRALWVQFRERLEAVKDPSWSAVKQERHIMLQASAWYCVTYDPCFNRQSNVRLWSFPWIAQSYLTRVRQYKAKGPRGG